MAKDNWEYLDKLNNIRREPLPPLQDRVIFFIAENWRTAVMLFTPFILGVVVGFLYMCGGTK